MADAISEDVRPGSTYIGHTRAIAGARVRRSLVWPRRWSCQDRYQPAPSARRSAAPVCIHFVVMAPSGSDGPLRR
jgi:hypothetical protein